MGNLVQPIIIITAPSGAGKTSITRYLLQKYPFLCFSVSAATRSPRGNEKEGVDYYFISEASFKEKIANHEFIEWEMVYEGKYYGTLHAEMSRIWQQNKVPVLDIDVKGALRLLEQYPKQCFSIFIEPPGLEELKKRLEARGTETPESLTTRLNKAAYEISFKENFHQTIVNRDLSDACAEAEKYILQFLHSVHYTF